MPDKTFGVRMDITNEPESPPLNNPNIFDIVGLFETTTTIPTETITKLSQQVKIYVDDISAPTTKRLYIYSNKTNSWHYVALT